VPLASQARQFREIRGVQQRRSDGARRRWFQDQYFDLFLVQDPLGRLTWFQLCYLRDTRRERVLEWRRGRGFLHLRPKDASYSHTDEGMLVLDGVMPYGEVLERFAASAGGLPPAVAAFISEKVREYELPSFRFRRRGAVTPRWLERLRRG
jgi:hypothetical protein